MGVKVREKPKGSGKYWIFVNHQGKRISKFAGDEKTAHEIAEKIQAKIILGDLGIDRIQKRDCPTLYDQAVLWLEAPHGWKESTRDTYQNTLRLHVYPELGHRKINELTRKEFKAFFRKLISKGLSPAMVALVRSPVFSILEDAVDSELIESNPLLRMNLKLRKKTSIEITPLTEAGVIQLLGQAKHYLNGAYYPVMLCALRTGMRIGEMQALEWTDIDFKSRLIQVKRSWRKNRVTEPKNGKGRSIGMTQLLTETLKDLRTERKKAALKNGRPLSAFVFNGTRNEMLHRETFRAALEECLDKAGLPRIRVHDLRHTYATIRILRGHNIGDVCHQLGHSSIRITYDIYGHWVPGRFQSEVDELDLAQQSAPQAHPVEKACEKL